VDEGEGRDGGNRSVLAAPRPDEVDCKIHEMLAFQE